MHERGGRVLLVSPHFPPDGSAATHRVRLLAPYLAQHGWEPTVVTVDPRDCEGRLDEDLASLVPSCVRVVRARAWRAASTRRFGFGDLGLRSAAGLLRACIRLLRAEQFDVVFITIYPAYTALLGPVLKRLFGLRFVIDYQDPWVGAWGASVGGGPDGGPDVKSRISRTIAVALERVVLASADAITAVSAGTYDGIAERRRRAFTVPTLALPIGWDRGDREAARARPAPNRWFDPRDGRVHLCYVGTILPTGRETVTALLGAVRDLCDAAPPLRETVRLHFIGTSNQSTSGQTPRVLPIAASLGLTDMVDEVPERIAYLEALTVLAQASGILLLGSTERHYTASKLFPALLAERPLLAIVHRESSVREMLERVGREPTVRIVTYDDRRRPEHVRDTIRRQLAALVASPAYRADDVDLGRVEDASAAAMASRLAGLFDRVTGSGPVEPQRVAAS